MGKITILEETTKNPITLIGKRASYCWGSDATNDENNYKRGLDCLESGHGRTFEFVNVELVIDGYSAKVIREWYTHIGGSPTRLQASTRYINYGNFDYITPITVTNNYEALQIYNETINTINQNVSRLNNLGIKKEDSSMLLPLGMTTRVVDKRNLRNLIDMSKQRMCTRAFWEYRKLFSDICIALKNYSPEWEYIVTHYMKPKCEDLNYCPEKKTCGRKPNKSKE